MLVGNDVKVKDIDKIHSIIDKPSKLDKEFQDSFGLGNMDFLGITNNAKHREYGHDIFGMINAMNANPQYGAEIYMSHIVLDKMSNIIRDSLGTDNRDMAEILFNRMLKSINETTKVSQKTNNPFLRKYNRKHKYS
ncbi:MAG: hypothetical protein ACTHKF_00815, partial [Candidatus Nitrosocosmicus sp.]